MKQESAVATYFTSLKLVNFRRFGAVDLNLLDQQGNIAQWTLLLGDNGVGKTTLLQALAWMRPVPVMDESSEEDEKEEIEVEQVEKLAGDTAELEPIRQGQIGCALTAEFNETIERLFRIDADGNFKLVAKLWQDGHLGRPPEPDSDGNGRRVTTDITFFFENDTLLDDDQIENPAEVNLDIIDEIGEFWEPFILSYGANRSMNPVATVDGRPVDNLAGNLSPTGTAMHDAEKELIALQSSVNEQQLEWLKENPKKTLSDFENAVEPSEEKRLLLNFKSVIVSLLPFVASENDIEIRAQRVVKGEVQMAQVRLRVHNLFVPFSELSLGYQTTLTWALDLAWRLSKQYSSLDDPLEQPAIVLIDEIDLHLHPKWQRTIMQSLSRLFPRTQFIATSHSPLMVQSMPKANFAIAQEVEDEIEIENTPEGVHGWRVDQILNSEYFDFDYAWDPETEQIFDERDALLEIVERSPEQNQRLVALEEEISKLPVATGVMDREAMKIIREAAAILKKTPPHYDPDN